MCSYAFHLIPIDIDLCVAVIIWFSDLYKYWSMYFRHVCILCIYWQFFVITPGMPAEKAYIQPVQTTVTVNTNAMMLELRTIIFGSCIWFNVFEYSFFGTEIGKLIYPTISWHTGNIQGRPMFYFAIIFAKSSHECFHLLFPGQRWYTTLRPAGLK